MEFKQHLKEMLNERNLSQRDLSRGTGIPPATISGWLNYNRLPDYTAIVILANFFEVTADYLLGREDDFGNVVISSGNVSGNGNTVNSHNTINARTAPTLSASDSELLRKYHSAPNKIQKAIKELLS